MKISTEQVSELKHKQICYRFRKLYVKDLKIIKNMKKEIKN